MGDAAEGSVAALGVAPAPDDPPPPEPLRVLLAEDEPDSVEVVRYLLGAADDLELTVCADGAEVVDAVSRTVPHVLLLDLNLPGVLGVDVLRALRASPATAAIPVLALSSTVEVEAKAAVFAEGACDYMVKYPARPEFLARVRYHARAYRHLLERDAAFAALEESRRQLAARNELIRGAFGRYVSPDIVEEVLARPGGLDLAGEERVVSVLMADLRGFTSESARLGPRRVVRMLNNFLAPMTEVVARHHGVVDEILGDAILGIFGAPVARDDHARQAVHCALEMMEALDDVNAINAEEGLPALRMGIGLNTGPVVVGNIGSLRRAKYAVVGPTVNLTARIEKLAAAGEVLASGPCVVAAGDGIEADAGRLETVKGAAAPIEIHRILGAT